MNKLLEKSAIADFWKPHNGNWRMCLPKGPIYHYTSSVKTVENILTKGDGLMEGLIRKLNKPVWLIRGSIEIAVLIIGFFMGGPVGIGTLLLAVAIGPSVEFAFKIGKYDSKKAQHMTFIDLYRNIKGINNDK